MKKFLIRVSIFILPLVVLAYLLDFVVSHGLRQSRYNDYSVWNDIFDGRIQVDIIVSGSSRAMVQASPAILDSALGVQSYNLGFNGYDFGMQLCRYNVYRAHNTKPKVILQEVDYGTFNKRDDLYEFEQFLPYLNDSIIYASTLNYEGLDFSDYHLPLIGYYSRYKHITFGVAEYFNLMHLRSSKQKGYLGNNLSWDGTFEKAKAKFSKGYMVPQNKKLIESFKSYLSACNAEGIKVVLVWMPEYIEGQKFVTNRDSVKAMYAGMADEYTLSFLDYSNDPLCFDKGMFYNSRHLNKTGAEKFTRKLAQDLLKLDLAR